MKALLFSSQMAVGALPMAFVAGTSVAGSPQRGSTAIQRQTAPITRADPGAETYRMYCASCHGVSGKGDGPAAGSMKTAPTDLTQLAKRNEGTFPTADFEYMLTGREELDLPVGFALFPNADFEQVLTGPNPMMVHGSPEMPVWGHVFLAMGDELLRVNNLSRYVASLQEK